MAEKRMLFGTKSLAMICAFVFIFSPHLSMTSSRSLVHGTTTSSEQTLTPLLTPKPKSSHTHRHQSAKKRQKSSLFLPFHSGTAFPGSKLKPSQHIDASSPITEKGLLYMYGSLLVKYSSLKCEVRGLFNRLIHRGHAQLAESLLTAGIPLVDLILMFEDEVRMCMVEDYRSKMNHSPSRKSMSHGGSSHYQSAVSSSKKSGKHSSFSLTDLLND